MLYKSSLSALLLAVLCRASVAQPTEAVSSDWVPPKPALAALSDHPEKVERVGGLFFGGLTEMRPLIFQYYHLGLLQGETPNVTLFLTNPGREDALIHLRKGVGKPSLDYFSTGHSNNVAWFKSLLGREGSIITVKPGETVPLFSQPLPQNHVVSGTLGLTLMKGDPVQFAFVARENQSQALILNNLLKESDVHSRGFYPAAVQQVNRTYRVGQQPLHIAIGAVRQQTFSGVRELRGDYGVTYQGDLTLVNDTQEEKKVRLVFNPRGGTATGTFLINNKIVEVPQTEAFALRPFHEETLSPNSSKIVKFATIPEGASSYPVRIVVE